MKSFFYCLSVFLSFLYSCKPEDNNSRAVLAGVYDAGMDYHEFNPALQISLKMDTVLNVSYGEDSLDINLDGNYDVIIRQRIMLNNNSGNDHANDTYPSCSLTIRNGVEVATKNEPFMIGHGQYSSINWVDTIAYKTNVVDMTNWSESNRTVLMWVEPPSTLFRPSDGPWYNLSNEEKYIALRMKIASRYRYGWIRVMETSREKISIISYALEN